MCFCVPASHWSDVYVDTISRVEITTRTRELPLEEEPEKFEVRAFDNEGEITIACYVCEKGSLFYFVYFHVSL